MSIGVGLIQCIKCVSRSESRTVLSRELASREKELEITENFLRLKIKH
ncbi:MAG: hypothetical protein ACI8VT_003433, partial [Saprospiraceae bacterium]